jgi:arylsulfatase A-like enzyme
MAAAAKEPAAEMTLSRRDLLMGAGAMAGTAAVLAACGPPPVPPPGPIDPNAPRTIVVIIADDMRFDYRGILTALDSSWIDCVSAAIEVPMCGPSRAALFSGKYSSRTGVVGNSFTYLMDDSDTIATRIHARGYKTVLSGKYLNDFPWPAAPTQYRKPGSYVPPGWDAWNADGSTTFIQNLNGQWPTDYVFQFATQQVLSTPASQPMFLWVGPTDPHLPANPPARHASDNPPLPPKAPSYNEADVSDKPVSRQFPLLSKSVQAAIDVDRIGIARCLLGVNDGLVSLFSALAATGRLPSAHLFFLSDNGYLLGEHRMVKKGEAYDEASRVPFMVRWPGVAGRTERGAIGSVDLSATVCALAGATPPGTDGVDLQPLLTRGIPVHQDFVYIEPPGGGWNAMRSTTIKYVEYGDGSRELYDLAADPFEMNNLAKVRDLTPYSARLAQLKP